MTPTAAEILAEVESRAISWKDWGHLEASSAYKQLADWIKARMTEGGFDR